MQTKTVALIGATGLIGSHLLELLKNDDAFTKLRVLVRRPVTFNHPKIEVIQLDFADAAAFKSAITGCDTVFSAVGTTQKKVKGDKVAYRKVDHDIAVNAARFCSETGGKHFLLVSSVGANANGGNFYLKLKGEVDDKVQTFGIPSVSIFRPSMLLGKRGESRPAEAIAQAISKPLSLLFPSNYKPIEAGNVAKAMVEVAKRDVPGARIFHYADMMALIA